MTVLNFVGGGTPGVSVSFTDNWVKSTSGVALPTTATIAANGNRPVYVATAKCYWAGNGGTRSMKLLVGGKSSATKSVASSSSASSSGDLAIGYLSLNGGTVEVKIDGNGSFYFGRATSTGSAVDSYGTTFAGALSGSVDYYTVPTAPTSVAVAQSTTENAVNVTWSVPSSNGGDPTAATYVIQWAYDSSFTGATTIVTGSSTTSYKITDLAYGSTVYVKVAAVNTAAQNAGTTSVFSSSASAYLVQPNLSLNGWANFGTLTNNTFTIERTSIAALLPKTGIIRKATASATGGSYSTGNYGIEKTYTNLTAGREYVVSGKAILMTASTPGNIYRFAVNGIGNGTSVTLTSTTVGATIPSYTFTASSTTHTIQVELAETFTVTATGTQEHVAVYDFALTRTAIDLAYRLQDNQIASSLVDQFDMATQSVGANWWIDKTNTTQFIQNFNYVVPTCTFSDVVGTGNLYFNDIQVSYDTTALVNQIAFKNAGRRATAFAVEQYEDYEVEWLDSDTTSIGNWGARKQELKTNLWTQTDKTNLVPNPHLSYSPNFLVSGNANLVLNRNLLTDMATGATNFMTAGATQPTTNAGLYIASGRVSANTPTVIFVYGGAEYNGAIQSFLVRPSTQYTASVYQRGGVGQSSMTARSDIRWYDINGATISTSSGAAVALTSTAWTRTTVTVTAPANAYTAVMFATFIFSGTNNTNNRYFSTCAQLQEGATATTWFSGDTPDDATYVYDWQGTPGQSSSVRYNNIMDTRTGELLTKFANPAVRIHSLKWNTAQNPVTAATLDIGSIITITFRGTTANYRVVGITHEATPDNWHMTLQVAKEN